MIMKGDSGHTIRGSFLASTWASASSQGLGITHTEPLNADGNSITFEAPRSNLSGALGLERVSVYGLGPRV